MGSVQGFRASTVVVATLFAAGCWSRLDQLTPGVDASAESKDRDSNSSDRTDRDKDGDGGGGGDVCQSGEKCGGDCEPCGLGAQCRRNSDCESGVCNGTCLPVGCGNGIKDDGETDIDCGGSCDPCEDGKRCELNAHCQSRVCDEDRCQEPTCNDGAKNGTETDKDCGGDCDACENGDACREDGDCKSAFCHEGTCTDPACADGAKNGSETDVDCGGTCKGCAPDQRCKKDDDCQSSMCLSDEGIHRCAEPTCGDKRKNGDESDVDCGGDCDPCGEGKRCNGDDDCVHRVCGELEGEQVCLAPSCDDGRKNGVETGKDCGHASGCGPCPTGEGCKEHDDCETNICTNGECRAPSCDDGRLNQDEILVDCGGTCDGCLGAGAACSNTSDCLSSRCNGVCQKGGTDTLCRDDAECLSGLCTGNICVPSGAGDGCYADADCLSRDCLDDGTCRPSGLTQACRIGGDCVSGRCDGSKGQCLPSQYVIETEDKQANDQQVDFYVWVNRGADDPERAWKDVALLYFFTAERQNDFVGRYYGNGPDQGERDSRFLAREYAANEWALIWRTTNGNNTLVPTTPMSNGIEFQVHANPAQNFDDTKHFSYQAGDHVPNPRVVLCQRVSGRWVHTQGQTPSALPAPCDLVVDSCPSGGTLACDVLQRVD